MPRHQPRKGIVLLIVLSLLTLLVVVGLTFMIVSNQFRRAGRSHQKSVVHRPDAANELLDQALNQLMTDTLDPHSAIRGHSLLRDMYGYDAVIPAGNSSNPNFGFRNVGPVAGGQFFTFTAYARWADSGRLLPFFDGLLTGRVLTIVNGPARMVSTRIIDHGFDPNTNVNTFRALVPVRGGLPMIPSAGNDFIINGKPFSGTGAGFNPISISGLLLDQQASIDASGQLGPASPPIAGGSYFDSLETGLMINWKGEPSANVSAFYASGYLDESYDAVDYQNVAIGAEIPTAGGNFRVIPSYHRPALVHYFVARIRSYLTSTYGIDDDQAGTLIVYPYGQDGFVNTADETNPPYTDVPANVRQQIAGLMRRIVLRPLPQEHPNFPNNSNFANAILAGTLLQPNSAWDIDTDGDGIKDAVWVDLGMPVRSDRQGRRYKPMFAFKILDMDGRLNLNAHGSPAHVAAYGSDPFAMALTGNTFTGQLATGMGYGPAEINLMRLFNDTSAEYSRLLFGDTTRNIPGRYGSPSRPGQAGFDTLAQVKFYELPPAANSNYFSSTYLIANSYQSPHDLRSEFSLGVGHLGGSLHERRPVGVADTISESPYEINLVQRGLSGNMLTAEDTAFSPDELERLLRANDIDASALPERLWQLVSTFRDSALGGDGNSSTNRKLVTTSSFDLPVTTHHSLDTSSGQIVVRDHYAYLLRQRLRTGHGGTIPQNDLRKLTVDLAPPEFFRGHRMDVNRPFGNGRDDNGNLVVDEVDVVPARRLESRLNPLWGGTVPDFDSDGNADPTDNNSFLVRYHYARHLYVLAMVLKRANIDFDQDGGATARETAYGLAQWAVNVVDFRDADSCMTPFEFDLNPFNGWSVDGIVASPDNIVGPPPSLNPERAVVWGMERPELLITESLAFHDLRVEDLDNPAGKTTDAMNADPDYDQRLRPRGATFIELYNPWVGDERAPAEFYFDQAAGLWRSGVILNKNVLGTDVPIWRIVVSKSTTNPDPWNNNRHGQARASIERSVYFTPVAASDPSHGRAFTTNVALQPLGPGRYAVIGSSGQTLDDQGRPLDVDADGNNDFLSPIGRLNTAAEGGGLDYANTRHIRLTPGADAAAKQVETKNNLFNEKTWDDMQAPIAVVINQPRSFNVSEPVDGYPADAFDNANPGPNNEEWDPTKADYEGAWEPPLDTPLDKGRLDDPYYARYATLHLQRLANPLLSWQEDATRPMNSTNPYITISSFEVDLTVFNGVGEAGGGMVGIGVPGGGLPTPDSFSARQRGDQAVAGGGPGGGCGPPGGGPGGGGPGGGGPGGGGPSVPIGGQDRAVWRHLLSSVQPPKANPANIGGHYFTENLRHSLGYLSTDFEPAFSTGNPPPAGLPNSPQAYIGFPDSENANPFPWLPWANRPFVSARELMLVPYTSSEAFSRFYAINQTNNYNTSAATQGPFRPYLNFFATSTAGANGADLYRIFDHLHVPSRFVGSETWLNPSVFNAGSGVGGTSGYHAPFNRVSAFRDPGKINLNTIFHRRIFQSLFDGGFRHNVESKDHPNPGWDAFVASRQGSTTSFPFMNSDSPSFFAKPFRGAEGLFVPLNSLKTDDIDATIMRRGPNTGMGVTNEPLFGGNSSERYRDATRHAYFRNQPLVRMENLVTTRSNVYAAWVTVGFFEVENVPPNPTVHPDGYRLGKELGTDTGEIHRHRAFYMIDRSIPVGFSPGQPLNSANCVILRRFIE